MRRSWIAATGAAALAACEPQLPRPGALDLAEPAERRLAFLDVSFAPDETPPPTPEELLMERLAAFAREVEERNVPSSGDAIALDTAALSAALQKIVAPLDRKAAVSVHIRDLASDTVLFDYHGDLPLNPASNHKLLTTAAALDLLGPDYRFETRALRRGGDLILVGEGDPTFDHLALAALAEGVRAGTDLATLERIVVDDAAFSARTFAPGFSDSELGLSYQAPSGALSLNFNTVEIAVGPGPDGAPLVSLFPPSTHVEIDNLASFGRGRPAIRTYASGEGEAMKTIIEITGKVRRRGAPTRIRRRIADPGLFTGGALAELLAADAAAGPLPVVRGRAPAYGEDVELLFSRESPPLRLVAADALAFSNNFMAEQLLRTLAWRTTRSPGDWDNGCEVVLAYWRALGLDPSELVFENGSGLSERGRVTTSALVDLIALAHRVHAEDGGVLSALPVAGERGTLRARLRRSGKRVRAKTGTLDGVSGLTGLITAEDGTPQVAFSILINVDPAKPGAVRRKRAEDQIVMAVLRHLDEWQAGRAAG